MIYTHVGCRPHVGYVHCGAKQCGHHLPQTGQVHALVVAGHAAENRFQALCGKVVWSNRGISEWGDPTAPNVVPGSEANHSRITCKRCLARLARAIEGRTP